MMYSVYEYQSDTNDWTLLNSFSIDGSNYHALELALEEQDIDASKLGPCADFLSQYMVEDENGNAYYYCE